MAHIRADLERIHDSGVLGQLDDPLAQLLRAGTNCKVGVERKLNKSLHSETHLMLECSHQKRP